MDEEAILNTQLTKAGQEAAVERVLSECQWDYFAILDVDPQLAVSDADSIVSNVKKTFRKTSLRLHPDRNSHPDAAKAFARLKKAELVISGSDDESVAERSRLIDIYKDVVSNLGLTEVAKVRSRIATILDELVQQQESEKHSRQRHEATRLAEQTKYRQDQETKRQRDRQWEDDRDDRVASWRTFVSKVEKKKKKTKKMKKLA